MIIVSKTFYYSVTVMKHEQKGLFNHIISNFQNNSLHTKEDTLKIKRNSLTPTGLTPGPIGSSVSLAGSNQSDMDNYYLRSTQNSNSTQLTVC